MILFGLCIIVDDGSCGLIFKLVLSEAFWGIKSGEGVFLGKKGDIALIFFSKLFMLKILNYWPWISIELSPTY